MTTERILEKLLEFGRLNDEDQKVSGIAQLAIDKGYENLSPAQQRVLIPFLTSGCEGVTDPGGYHNDCQTQLSNGSYLEALEESEWRDAVQCENCRFEADDYEQQRESFFRD
ncbi:hypothetical protein N7V09_01885 [Shewanella seohaensis]|uniref:hypothetical protein n=1 Tax=Shewanella seohaensis TaxID=755175 RepID=UPI00200EDB64|nr:hypothetical protein [Shewanella seohaensis]MCL1122264.1 hypothetical protein [Shewanella seohaensis]UXM82439.1 hypothetical protein N7V09_01885 [Shewanella seohaensis]